MITIRVQQVGKDKPMRKSVEVKQVPARGEVLSLSRTQEPTVTGVDWNLGNGPDGIDAVVWVR